MSEAVRVSRRWLLAMWLVPLSISRAGCARGDKESQSKTGGKQPGGPLPTGSVVNGDSTVPGNAPGLASYVIAEPCIGVKDTACVDVCPVDCIHPRKDEAAFVQTSMLYINPEECIDCSACLPACPVHAVFTRNNLPDKWKSYSDINHQYLQGRFALRMPHLGEAHTDLHMSARARETGL